MLPELEAAYGGRSRLELARAAALAREDAEWLDRSGERPIFRTVLARRVAGRRLELSRSSAGSTAEPAAIRRRVLLRALRSGRRRA